MIRTLVVAFGAMTALAVLGSTTPTGQAMLGLKPAVKSAPVTVIEDAPVAAPAQHIAGQQPRPAGLIAPPRPSPFVRRAAPIHPSPTAQPAQTGLGPLSNVARILLNLPQELDRARIGGARGHGPWDESQPVPFKKHHGREGDSQDTGGDH